MSRIYSSTNRIKFTDIPEKYAIPRAYKGKQCDAHSAVVTYVYDNFKNTKKYKKQIVDVLNYLTFCILENSFPPFQWNPSDPLSVIDDDIDTDAVEEGLGDLYLADDAIEWSGIPLSDDTEEVTSSVQEEPKSESVDYTQLMYKRKSNTSTYSEPASAQATTTNTVVNRPLKEYRQNQAPQEYKAPKSTPKEDLYIQPPKYPTFDISKIWMSKVLNGRDKLVIYTTLPEIPTKQNEISVTTNLNAMTDSELLNLFPDHVIHTRSPKMYEKQEGLDYDEDLGIIIPIEGFTKEEIVDNIIQYPHLYKLKKFNSEGKLVNFYTTLEIDGELIPVSEVWNTLPESKLIPCDSEFAKEYVVRRYLLEEEHGVQHRYKLFGTLDPFLTLFMPPNLYNKRGYTDSIHLAKACVNSRIRYKQSRNPILRRMNTNA